MPRAPGSFSRFFLIEELPIKRALTFISSRASASASSLGSIPLERVGHQAVFRFHLHITSLRQIGFLSRSLQLL